MNSKKKKPSRPKLDTLYEVDHIPFLVLEWMNTSKRGKWFKKILENLSDETSPEDKAFVWAGAWMFFYRWFYAKTITQATKGNGKE
jgi:hypothetical protein